MTFRPAATGLFGKLPTRGDFVRVGLPEDFVSAWDLWCRQMLAATRAALSEAWLEAWMEAPIWRFLLPAGECGTQAVLGVWLPSVDKVGRQFPLALCALAPFTDELSQGANWLEVAEAAGLAGVLEDAPHEALAVRLADLPAETGAEMNPGWWTEGGPNMAPRRLAFSGLPPEPVAAGMLRDFAVSEAG